VGVSAYAKALQEAVETGGLVPLAAFIPLKLGVSESHGKIGSNASVGVEGRGAEALPLQAETEQQRQEPRTEDPKRHG